MDFILDRTQTYTYYTQRLCNHIYASETAHIDVDEKVLHKPSASDFLQSNHV